MHKSELRVWETAGTFYRAFKLLFLKKIKIVLSRNVASGYWRMQNFWRITLMVFVSKTWQCALKYLSLSSQVFKIIHIGMNTFWLDMDIMIFIFCSLILKSLAINVHLSHDMECLGFYLDFWNECLPVSLCSSLRWLYFWTYWKIHCFQFVLQTVHKWELLTLEVVLFSFRKPHANVTVSIPEFPTPVSCSQLLCANPRLSSFGLVLDTTGYLSLCLEAKKIIL